MSVGDLVISREAEWIIPATLLTCGSAAFVLLEMPNYSGIIPALTLLPMWMVVAGAMGAVLLLIETIQMMMRGVDNPLARLGRLLLERLNLLIFITCGMLLTGLNMIVFMWTKPLLNYLVPFWADPYLAGVDRSIFGTDPWRLLGWLNSDFTAIFYHRVWFALMIIMLLKVLSSPSSREKSATLLTYFALWSLFGPLVHMILPAAGPVFYERMGYGTQFAGLPQAHETREAADYLWRFYVGSKFGPASGISAMPSLHIATTAWIVIAAYLFARRWLWLIVGAAVLIFLLSISLGWHYAIDGVVGGLGACAMWLACSAVLSLWLAPRRIVGQTAGA